MGIALLKNSSTLFIMFRHFLLLLLFLLPALVQSQVFESSNLPILIIETSGQAIVDEPKVTAQMNLIYNGPGQRNFVIDPPNDYSGWIGIELRGATSQQLFDKKGFGVETRDEFGENRNVSLLGMPEENDWVLHGPYSDKSLMRNALAYQIGASIMSYSPRSRFVEVLLNGAYHGVYLLTEKIKRDKNRVDISKLTPEVTEGDDLTGGYILKIDKESGERVDGFYSEYDPIPGSFQKTYFQYHYPKPGDINWRQEDYIEGFINEFEEVLAGANYDDPLEGYSQYIDVNTFVDYFIINELLKNVDAYRLSTYMYKDRDSVDPKLKLGPIWDFNLGMGNVDFCMTGTPEDWVITYNSFCPEDFFALPFWWRQFWKDKNFRIAIKNRWEELRAEQLSNNQIMAHIDSMTLMLTEAQERNFQRWPVLSQYVWPNWFVGDTYQQEVNYLKDWMEKRILWIEGQMETITDEMYFPEDYFFPRAFPNPFFETLTVECYIRATQKLNIRLFNAQGQLVYSKVDQEHSNGLLRFDLPLHHLATGIYFYQILVDDQLISTQKVIKHF